MKVFLDANVIISVLNKEYPLFTYSARILSLSSYNDFWIFVSPLSLAIAFYFAAKKSGEAQAKKKINKLLENISVTTINAKISQKAITNPKIYDFEDGMQYYSAVAMGCEIIVTSDKNDYYFSDIPVVDSEEFLKDYL